MRSQEDLPGPEQPGRTQFQLREPPHHQPQRPGQNRPDSSGLREPVLVTQAIKTRSCWKNRRKGHRDQKDATDLRESKRKEKPSVLEACRGRKGRRTNYTALEYAVEDVNFLFETFQDSLLATLGSSLNSLSRAFKVCQAPGPCSHVWGACTSGLCTSAGAPSACKVLSLSLGEYPCPSRPGTPQG